MVGPIAARNLVLHCLQMYLLRDRDSFELLVNFAHVPRSTYNSALLIYTAPLLIRCFCLWYEGLHLLFAHTWISTLSSRLEASNHIHLNLGNALSDTQQSKNILYKLLSTLRSKD